MTVSAGRGEWSTYCLFLDSWWFLLFKSFILYETWKPFGMLPKTISSYAKDWTYLGHFLSHQIHQWNLDWIHVTLPYLEAMQLSYFKPILFESRELEYLHFSQHYSLSYPLLVPCRLCNLLTKNAQLWRANYLEEDVKFYLKLVFRCTLLSEDPYQQ